VRLAESAAEHGEVLAEHENEAAIDHAVSRHDPVARYPVVRHAKIAAAMFDEHVPFLERAFVQQQFEPLSRRKPAFAVLRGDALLPAA
jgi:hypothetical protein